MFSHKFYRNIVNSISDGLVITNAKGKIVFVNSVLCKMFGHEDFFLIGKTIEVLIPVDLKKGHISLRDSYMESPKSRPHGIGLDVYALKKDGSTFPVEVSLNYFKENSEEYILSIIIDITRRKEKEKKRQNFIFEQERIKRVFIKTQLEVLKKQISPHFLFNCLSVLYSMIENKQLEAMDFVRKIREMYGYALESRNRRFVDVQQELSLLKTYLEVQKMRFDNRFEVEYINIDKLSTERILPFSLQIIAENIFKHNKIIYENKYIIKILCEGDYITITNPIIEKEDKNTSHKIGLENLKQQYELISDLKPIITRDNHFFSVKIPLFKNDLDD